MRPPGSRTCRLTIVVLSTLLMALGAVVSTEGKNIPLPGGSSHAANNSTSSNSESSYELKITDTAVLVADSQVDKNDRKNNGNNNNLTFSSSSKQAIAAEESALISSEDTNQSVGLLSSGTVPGRLDRTTEDNQRTFGPSSHAAATAADSANPKFSNSLGSQSLLTVSFNVTDMPSAEKSPPTLLDGDGDSNGGNSGAKSIITSLEKRRETDTVDDLEVPDFSQNPSLLNGISDSTEIALTTSSGLALLPGHIIADNALPNLTSSVNTQRSQTTANGHNIGKNLEYQIDFAQTKPTQQERAKVATESFLKPDPKTAYTVDSVSVPPSVESAAQDIEVVTKDHMDSVPSKPSQLQPDSVIQGSNTNTASGSRANLESKSSHVIVYMDKKSGSKPSKNFTTALSESATKNMSDSSFDSFAKIRLTKKNVPRNFLLATTARTDDRSDDDRKLRNMHSHYGPNWRRKTKATATNKGLLTSRKSIWMMNVNRSVHFDNTEPARSLTPIFVLPEEASEAKPLTGNSTLSSSKYSMDSNQPASTITTYKRRWTELQDEGNGSLAILSRINKNGEHAKAGGAIIPLTHFGGQRFIEFGVVRTRRGPRVLTNHILTRTSARDIRSSNNGMKVTNLFETNKNVKLPRAAQWRDSRPLAIMSGTLIRMPEALIPNGNETIIAYKPFNSLKASNTSEEDSTESSAESSDDRVLCKKDRTRRKRKVFRPKPVSSALTSMFEFKRMPKKRTNSGNSSLPKTLAETRANDSSEATDAIADSSGPKKGHDDFLHNVLRDFGVQVKVVPTNKTANATNDQQNQEACSKANCSHTESGKVVSGETHNGNLAITLMSPTKFTIPMLPIIPSRQVISSSADQNIMYSIPEGELSALTKPGNTGNPITKIDKNSTPSGVNSLLLSSYVELPSNKGQNTKQALRSKVVVNSTKSARLGVEFLTGEPARGTQTTTASHTVDVNNPAKETFIIDLTKLREKNKDNVGRKPKAKTIELTPGKVYVHDLETATFEEAPDEDGALAKNLAARKKYEDDFLQNVLRNFGVQIGHLNPASGNTKDGSSQVEQMSAGERNVDARTAHAFAKNTSLPFAGDSTTPVFPAQQPQALTVSLNHRPANVNYLQSQEHTTAPAPPSHVTVYSGITPEALLPPFSQQPEKLSQQRPQFTAPVSTQTPTQTSSLALSQPPVSDEVILGRSKEALPPETAFRIDQQQKRPQTTKFSGGSSTFRINHAGAQVHYNSVHPGSFGFIRSIPRSAPQSSTAENPHPFLVSLRPLVVQNIQPPDTSSASVQAPLVPSVPATNEIQTSSQALYAQLPLLTYAGHISTSRLSPQTSRLFVQSPEAIKIIPSPNLSGVQPSSQAQVPRQLPGYVLPPQNVVSQPLVPKSQQLPSIALLDERPVLQPSQQVVVNQQQDVTKASQAPELQYVDEQLATPGTSQNQIVIGHQQKQRLPVSVERLTDPTATVQVQPVPQQAPLTALYTSSIVSGQITKQIGQQIPAPVQQGQTVVRQEQPSLIPTVQSVLPPNGQQIHLINNEQATFSVNQADTLGKIRQEEAPVQKQGSEIQRQQIQHVQLPQQQIDIQQESSFSQPPFQLQHQARIIHVPVQYQLQEHAPSVGNQQTIPQFRTHFPLQVFRPAQQTLIQPTVFSNNLPSLSGGQISSSNSPYPLPVFTYVFRNSRLQRDPSGLVGNQNRHTNIHSSVVQNNFRTGHNDFRTIRPILGIGQSVNIRPSSKSFFGASNSFGSLPSPSNFEGFHVTHLEGTTKKGATALSNFRPDVNGILSDVYSEPFNPGQQTGSSFRLNFGYRAPQANSHNTFRSTDLSLSDSNIKDLSDTQKSIGRIFSRISSTPSSASLYPNVFPVQSSAVKPFTVNASSSAPSGQNGEFAGLTNVDMRNDGPHEFTGYIKKSKAKAR